MRPGGGAQAQKAAPIAAAFIRCAAIAKCKSVLCGRVEGGGGPAPGVPVPPVAPRCVVRRLAGVRGAGGVMVSHLCV